MTEVFLKKCKNCGKHKLIKVKYNCKSFKFNPELMENYHNWFCSIGCYNKYNRPKSRFERFKKWLGI